MAGARTGQERTGQDRPGQDRTGQDRTGTAGEDRTGQLDLNFMQEFIYEIAIRLSPGLYKMM